MRVGIVGAGSMGSCHAAAWKTSPAQVAAIFSLDEKQKMSLAKAAGAKACGTLQELIAEVDIVDICSPTHTHCAVALEAAQAGAPHTLREAPGSMGEQAAQLPTSPWPAA